MKEILEERALKLRKNSSQVERIMWSLLRDHEYQKEYDDRRTQYLRLHGYKVLRFANAAVLNDRVDQILSDILKALSD